MKGGLSNIATEKNIITVWAQREIGETYGLDWYQVKVSSGKPEVDAFIPQSQWAKLNETQQTALRELVGHTFELPTADVDFYQFLPRPGEEWKIPVSGVNPKTTVPRGSVGFLSGGTVEHSLLGG